MNVKTTIQLKMPKLFIFCGPVKRPADKNEVLLYRLFFQATI